MVLFSSTLLFTGDDYDSTAFRTGGLYHPFRNNNNSSLLTSERPPLLCLKCGGYLNKYCVINEETNDWSCSLCQQVNPSFTTEYTRENLDAYVELQQQEVEFIERDLSSLYSSSGVTEHIHMFAIDTCVSSTEDMEKFLRCCFECVHENSRVCVVGFGKCINILRLCGGGESDTAIIADVLPGNRDCSHTLRHFFQQGEYLTPACKALLIVKDIARALKCIGVGIVENKTVTTTTCSSLLQVARGLGDVHGPGLKMLLITSRTIPLGNLPPHMSKKNGVDALLRGGDDQHDNPLSRIEGFSALGHDACITGRCWIDAIVVGLHAVQLDLFDALVSSSGGSVISGYSLQEEVIVAFAEHVLKLPTSCFPPHSASRKDRRPESQRLNSEGTIFCEVRTSSGVMPERIFGQGVMQQQDDSTSNWLNGIANNFYESDSLSCKVDRFHVANMVEITAPTYQPNPTSSTADAIYKQLCRSSNGSEHVCACAFHRADPDFALSFVLHPNEKFMKQERTILQLILRFRSVSNDANGTHCICHHTRIMTYELPHTDDKYEYLSVLDVDIWSSVVARAIAGDLHAATDGLGLPKASHEEKKDPIAAFLTTDDGIHCL